MITRFIGIRFSFFILIVLCALPLPLAAAGKGEGAEATDTAFRPLLPAHCGPFRRIVSLSPALTEAVFALDAGELLVGRTDWCDWPPEAAAIPSVGGFSGATISLESLRALSPDLVLLSPMMHGRLVAPLERAGIAVVGFDPDSFASIFETLEALARLLEREDAATRLLGELKVLLESVRPVSSTASGGAGEGLPRVFYLLQDEPFMTAGSGNFIDELIKSAGGLNIFSDIDQAWPTVSFEAILLRRPTIILTDTATAARLLSPEHLAHSPLPALEAVKRGSVIALDPGELSRPGPRLIALVPTLARALEAAP